MIDDSMDEESTEPLIEEVQNDEAEPMQGTGPSNTCRESLDILLLLLPSVKATEPQIRRDSCIITMHCFQDALVLPQCRRWAHQGNSGPGHKT